MQSGRVPMTSPTTPSTLKASSYFPLVEYGIETTRDVTLKRINRGHTYADTVETVNRTAACGILTGGHVILGLPGETHDEIIAQAAG